MPCKTQLVIELNTNYPKEKPKSLKVIGDLPEASKSKLNEILNALSEEKSKQGEVYLYDLCVFTQEPSQFAVFIDGRRREIVRN